MPKKPGKTADDLATAALLIREVAADLRAREQILSPGPERFFVVGKPRRLFRKSDLLRLARRLERRAVSAKPEQT